MIAGLTRLVALQFVGEVVARTFDLPVPGPIIGMLLLFALLRWRDVGDDAPVVRAGTALLRHLQLLFVPAGVGVVAYLSVLGENAAAIAVSLLVSYVLGLAVVGWTAQGLERVLGARREATP